LYVHDRISRLYGLYGENAGKQKKWRTKHEAIKL